MFRSLIRHHAEKPAAAVAASAFEQQYANTGSGILGGPERKKTSLAVSVGKHSGALLSILQPIKNHGLNLHSISNRHDAYNEPGRYTTMFLDLDAHESDPNFIACLGELRKLSPFVSVAGSWRIPWFPTEINDLDRLDQTTLAAGGDLQDDPNDPHPGFHDVKYRERRKAITANALGFKQGGIIPDVPYAQEEVDTWGVVWDKLTALYPTHACKEYNYIFPRLVENAGYGRNNIPQLQQVSDFLQSTTGFTLRPVTGLLSSRDFLNALAFRVFFSTQYIRHHSKPLYTPEPDVIHELMGHAPLFADPDFADFSQEIGLASLGASDEAITKLARCYWYSIEFGMCKQGNGVRAYGAGLLSSFGELQYCVGKEPTHLPWDPYKAAEQEFPITKYQPLYFVATNFRDAKYKLKEFTHSLDLPFELKFNQMAKKVLIYPRTAEQFMTS